jgi:hypothetical protein
MRLAAQAEPITLLRASYPRPRVAQLPELRRGGESRPNSFSTCYH